MSVFVSITKKKKKNKKEYFKFAKFFKLLPHLIFITNVLLRKETNFSMLQRTIMKFIF